MKRHPVSFILFILVLLGVTTAATAQTSSDKAEKALAAVKEHRTSSGESIGSLIESRSGKRKGSIGYGDVEWMVKKLPDGKGHLITCVQAFSTYKGKIPVAQRSGNLSYRWLYDGNKLFAIGKNGLNEGLPVLIESP